MKSLKAGNRIGNLGWIVLLALLSGASAGVAGELLGTAFTYQGSLQEGGSPTTGSFDFEVKAFDDLGAGAQVGATVTKDDVTVTAGLFTMELDFGAGVFTGEARWLEIAVRDGSSTGAYTTLSPRQPLTAAPYSLFADAAQIASDADTLDMLDSADFVQLNEDGNVGIGTTNPQDILNVQSTVNGQGIEVSDGNGVEVVKLSLGATDAGAINLYDGGAQKISLNAGQDSFFLDGNMGIGTTSPQGLFDATLPSGKNLVIGDDGIGRVEMLFPNDSFIKFNDSQGSTVNILNFDNSDRTAIGGKTGTGITIYPSLNVGIGTTGFDINHRLDVNGSINSKGLDVAVSSGESLTIGDDGIGRVEMLIPNDGFIKFKDFQGSPVNILSFDNSDRTFIGSKTGTALTILPDQNVGIGTSAPDHRLHVHGGDIAVTSGSFIDDGTLLNVPDYVFEPEYQLESIEEHAEYMWREKHLPAVASAREIEENKRYNMAQRREQLLEELEKAHIYIVQLHAQMKDLQAIVCQGYPQAKLCQ